MRIDEHIIAKNYYQFTKGKTPERKISSLLGTLIKNDDTRIKRIKGDGNYYMYYLAKFEQDLNINEIASDITEKYQPKQQKKKKLGNKEEVEIKFMKNCLDFSGHYNLRLIQYAL